MDLALNAERASIDPNNGRTVSVDLEGVDVEDVIDSLEIKDIISFKKADILDEIGVDECIQYFGIKVAEE
jgi:hypothetical protein